MLRSTQTEQARTQDVHPAAHRRCAYSDEKVLCSLLPCTAWARAGALEQVLIRILYDFTLLHTVAAMYSPEQVQWGIIGVGDVCEVKSGPALQV